LDTLLAKHLKINLANSVANTMTVGSALYWPRFTPDIFWPHVLATHRTPVTVGSDGIGQIFKRFLPMSNKKIFVCQSFDILLAN